MKKLFSTVIGLSLMASLSLPVFAADSESPTDVEGLKATAMNKSVKLKWAEATDDTGVEGYRVHYGTKSVTKPGQGYDSVKDAGDVTEYTLSGLENGKKYYFSVVAYDAAENESVAWAPEVSATPSASGAAAGQDEDAPQVSKAEAENKMEVKVVFSEKVVLPAEDAEEAFLIENDDTLEELTVLKAEMDEEDEDGKTVILTTADQEKGASYKLTVAVDLEDEAGNPIISGTSDTAIFTGSDKEKTADDSDGPKLVDVEIVDSTNILLTFDETIVLGIDPSKNFTIMAAEDPTEKLEVLGVKLGVNSDGVEDASAMVTTGERANKAYTVVVSGVKDDAGNEVDSSNASMDFGSGDGSVEEDTVPPKDVAKFMSKKLFEAQQYTVTLSWVIPKENVGDVVEQILYMSLDKGENYEKEASLEAEVTEHEMEGLDPGEYWFKITQKDAAGNESEGVITKVVLSETGPGIVGLALVSLGLGRVFGRRKR